MSYDLMVFNKEVAPKNETNFMEWYENQIQWSENNSFDDLENTSEDLKDWFMDIKNTFPAKIGPFSSDDEDDPKITDFRIGKNFVQASFDPSQAELAYPTMFMLAGKHKVGFFDKSAKYGIFFPDKNGSLKSLKGKKESRKSWWKFW